MVAFRGFDGAGFLGESHQLKKAKPSRDENVGKAQTGLRQRYRAHRLGSVHNRSEGVIIPPTTICTGPLSVLVALADPGLDVAPILSALQHHYALVCSAPATAVEADSSVRTRHCSR